MGALEHARLGTGVLKMASKDSRSGERMSSVGSIVVFLGLAVGFFMFFSWKLAIASIALIALGGTIFYFGRRIERKNERLE